MDSNLKIDYRYGLILTDRRGRARRSCSGPRADVAGIKCVAEPVAEEVEARHR
jgi:hypothetical protein